MLESEKKSKKVEKRLDKRQALWYGGGLAYVGLCLAENVPGL